MPDISKRIPPDNASAVLVFADESVIWGTGIGAEGVAPAEICFNTAMSGYQESLSDPSFAGQIITFTFPHIGNIGTNTEDLESINPAVRGCILREDITQPSSWRAGQHFNDWLIAHRLPGMCGVDTRALTRRIRDGGAPNGVLCHNAAGEFDLPALLEQAKGFSGLEGLDLAKDVSCTQSYTWDEACWSFPSAASPEGKESKATQGKATQGKDNKKHVVAVDFGAKQNILRCLVSSGCQVTVVPANTTAEEILAHQPDGVFLSNGPGDPAATGAYAVPMVQGLMAQGVPIFGICLGHQILALALGGKTEKMHLGHRGANHPVKDLETGKVEITSQNHGFVVVPESLPEGVEPTHISLFDGSNEGLRVRGKPIFSVQYHPEASPGPQDSHYLFDRFVEHMRQAA